jgi:hypothetical protein
MYAMVCAEDNRERLPPTPDRGEANTPYLDKDYELLSLVVDEPLRGVDVAQRFPLFWGRIEADAGLYERLWML